jgi:hypothetical protein
MGPRALTTRERAVLERLLAFDAPGAPSLRSHLDLITEVYNSCDCGCASVGFAPPDKMNHSPDVSTFPVDVIVHDDVGNPIGGMVLFTRSGRLHDLDVYTWTDNYPFPRPENIVFEHP